jgi:hypothetical protein
MKQFRMCFTIDEQTDKILKDLPRSYKISEKLRGALKEILDQREKSINKGIKAAIK